MTTHRYVAPGIVRRYRTYYAVHEVPKALRAKMGRVRFRQTLKTDSLQVAKARAAVLIAGWKAQIEQARSDNPVDDATFYRHALKQAKTETERQRLLRDIRIVAGDMVGATSFRDDATLVEVKAHRAEEQAEADKWAKVAAGETVLIAEHIEPWLETTTLAAKTVASARKELADFAIRFPSADDMTREALQKWVYGLSNQIGASTLRKRLAHVRNLWRYLQRQGLVASDLDPLDRLDIPKQPKNGNGKRKPFTRDQINHLLEMSHYDQPMNDLIKLAAYTGCRIEELCSLKTKDVTLDGFRIVSGKTAAAEREIPVHTAIKPLVSRLLAESKDGYLLSGLKVNKLGQRSHNIGRYFGLMKDKLGYGPELVFHSIRKTVATQFEEAGVQEVIAARILGHEIKTMSYGLYSGGVSLAVKREAMEKAIHY